MSGLHKNLGFTLVELMVTIAVVAIGAALAYPSFTNVIQSNRAATGANELIASLTLARSEALRHPSGVTVCTSADGASCGGSWTDGWMVWVDKDGNGSYSASDDVLRYTEGPKDLEVSVETAGGAAEELMVQFDSRGRALGSRREFAVQPRDCGEKTYRREIRLSVTGQVTASQGATKCK